MDHLAHLKDVPKAEGLFAKGKLAARLFRLPEANNPEPKGVRNYIFTKTSMAWYSAMPSWS